jgi:UDP-N-acetylmuramoyl-L-alanyl-D-glutamate--2,6-diaminopimelate ligase
MLRLIDIPSQEIVSALKNVQVAGRLEKIKGSNGAAGIEGFVDYAHTPDAVQRVLAAVREHTKGQVIAVMGAGGDRDVTKRPLMGQLAASLADQLIITDDNPRSEDPALIRSEILAGVNEASKVPSKSIHEVADRALAITTAVQLARPGDVVVVLGKGHELGQEIAGVMTPFDDRVVLELALEAINAGVR